MKVRQRRLEGTQGEPIGRCAAGEFWSTGFPLMSTRCPLGSFTLMWRSLQIVRMAENTLLACNRIDVRSSPHS